MEINDNIISDLFDSLLNFKMNEVPENTRFWMIRTKKGYFYHEIFTKNFVALAWNIITQDTNFEQSELLNDSVLLHYKEIKRPTLVINKCKSFIYDIKVGDILVIPSEGSRYITFAYAGEYYEEPLKTYELETNIIDRIEDREVRIDEISCPYKKRRHITPIRTVKSAVLNYHLYRAISSYHGINCLDEYGTIILDHIFNYYTFRNCARLVFHVTKDEQITSKEFSGFLYSVNSILSSTGMDEHYISTQASVHSEGDIVFTIREAISWLSSNYLWFVAIVAVIGGGKFLTVDLPGIPKIIKDFMSIKTDKDAKAAELVGKKLENYNKALELMEKMEKSGITMSDLEKIEPSLKLLSTYSSSMQIVPLATTVESNINISSDIFETDNEEETA